MSVVRKIRSTLFAGLLCAVVIAGFLAWQGGYRLYIVHTGSMAPTILAGDVVLDGPPKATYRPGEVITFRHSNRSTDLVTHSVIEFKNGVIRTKGDANRTPDAWEIRPDQVQGVVVRRLPRLGYLFIFLRQPLGIASVVVGGLALMLWRRQGSPRPNEGGKSDSKGEEAPSTLPGEDVIQDPPAAPEPESPAESTANKAAT